MRNLLEPTWQNYTYHAQELGLTIMAILQDFRHCGDFTISEIHVKALLATSNSRPLIGYTCGLEARRFILYSQNFLTRGDEHGEVPPLFYEMEMLGFQIEGEIDEIARLGEEKFALEKLNRYAAADNIDDPILQDLVLRSHELGYTLGEIIQNLQNCHRGNKMRISIEDLRKTLIENDITKEIIQAGCVWGEKANDYVKSACRIGLDKDQILHRLYTHGYDKKSDVLQDLFDNINADSQKGQSPELFALPETVIFGCPGGRKSGGG